MRPFLVIIFFYIYFQQTLLIYGRQQLLVHPFLKKMRNNYGAIQLFYFQYCDSNIGLFFIVIVPDILCFILVLVLCLFFFIAFLRVFALPQSKRQKQKNHYFSPSPLKARKSDNFCDNYMKSNIEKRNERNINLIEKLEE